MLENMLPRQVLEYAIGGAGPIGSLAYQHDQVTVLFMVSKQVQRWRLSSSTAAHHQPTAAGVASEQSGQCGAFIHPLLCCGTPQDIVGFTSMSKNVEPHLVMGFLNHLFSRLDEMCEAFDIYKVSPGTVGHGPSGSQEPTVSGEADGNGTERA